MSIGIVHLIRRELLKEALEDPETRIKMNCASTWKEVQDILAEFVKKKGSAVAYIEGQTKGN